MFIPHLKFPPIALVAVIVAAAVVTPVALASAKGHKPPQSALVQRIGKLAKRVEALEAKPAPTTPTSLPPSGPAGGSLTGAYPAPQLRADSVAAPQIASGAVGSEEIASDAVGAEEIAPHSVGTEEIAPLSVGSNELGVTAFVQGQGVAVAAGTSAEATVTCPAGHPRLLSGGIEWANDTNGTAVIYSVPSPETPSTTWVVRGRIDTGGAANTVFAEALCL